MLKERLKATQGQVYQILQQALTRNTLSHAYLFQGKKGTMKKEAALLLAASIVCDQKDFACETCATCQRIIQGNYADLIFVDGSEEGIKKADILRIQSQFNKTGIEAANKKIYILNHVETASQEAMNALLKFLEEPSSQNVCAILLCERMENLLPTIVSRCALLLFQTRRAADCFADCKANIDELDAYLLSRSIRNADEIVNMSESEEYQHAFYIFKEFLEQFIVDPYQAILFVQNEGFTKDYKAVSKAMFTIFLDLLITFYKDLIKDPIDLQKSWYQAYILKYRTKKMDYVKMLQALMNGKDQAVLNSVNIGLLIDQTLYSMKEVSL